MNTRTALPPNDAQRTTRPQARQAVRRAARTTLERLDRWTLETFNPVGLLPLQRTR